MLVALAAIHERRNLLVPINRLPLDILFLIPVHFTSLSDRLRATFVCRRWRRAFIQHPPLWSQLYWAGSADPDPFITLLQRARGTALDITIDHSAAPVRDVTILSSLTPQIRSLTIENAHLDKVQALSAAISGPLPLLHTLEIDAGGLGDDPPTLPLFANAVDLKNLTLTMGEIPCLPHFVFPNITTLDFSTAPVTFIVSQLLNFLESSPGLQCISLEIKTCQFDEDVPPERVIVLPNVKTFDLRIICDGAGWEISTHISCPSAERTKFYHSLPYPGYAVPENIYPPSHMFSTIVRQYTTSTVDQVVFELKVDEQNFIIDCWLTFTSSNGVSFELHYEHLSDDPYIGIIIDERFPEVISQACRTIRDHPFIVGVRYFRIHGGGVDTGDPKLTANDVGRLLGSMGSLERLTLYETDLLPFLAPFLDTPLYPNAIQPTSFPLIKELVIILPTQLLNDRKWTAAIVRLARSQQARGTPFESIRLEHEVPLAVIEELVPLVTGTVKREDKEVLLSSASIITPICTVSR